jgi:hypothetical protein
MEAVDGFRWRDKMANGVATGGHELEKVKPWLEAMAERGTIQGTTARLRATALDQLTSILAEDEPRVVEWVLEKLDEIAARWATKNNAKAETAQAYKSRAKGALEGFLQYNENPLGFRPTGKAARAKSPRKNTERQPSEATPEALGPSPSSTLQAQTNSAGAAGLDRSYPLDSNGKEFRFRIPSGGITMRDVQRIGWHLATIATDFDPCVVLQRNPLIAVDQPNTVISVQES